MKNIYSKIAVIAFIATVAVSMTSCGLYGKFKPKNEAEIDSIKTPAYTDIFKDEKLIALIDTALANNLDLKIAHENVAQAEAILLGAKLAYIPSIYASPSATWGKSIGNVSPGWSYGFGTASWEIDIFGRLTNKLRIAKASKKEQEDYVQAATVELVSAVATTYYTLQMLDAQIQTTEEAILNRAQSVETMKSMKAAGMTDEAAVAQFEASFYASVAQGKTLTLSRIQAENAMRLLLCKAAYEVDRGSLYETVMNDSDIETIQLEATRVRPDVKAAEHQLEQAFYNMNLARANCCPSITLTGSIGWNGGLIYNAVGSLIQPLFNSGRNIAEVRSAKHALQAAEYAYSKSLIVAATEVNDAMAAKRLYRAQQPDYDNQVVSLARAYDATFTKMYYGQGTYLEVLTAQKDLLSAQMQQIQNYASTLNAGVDLYKALGGGK